MTTTALAQPAPAVPCDSTRNTAPCNRASTISSSASRLDSGQTISGLAREFRGVSEFVLPDANCGDQQV